MTFQPVMSSGSESYVTYKVRSPRSHSFHLAYSERALATVFQAMAYILLLLSFRSPLESSAQQNKVFCVDAFFYFSCFLLSLTCFFYSVFNLLS